MPGLFRFLCVLVLTAVRDATADTEVVAMAGRSTRAACDGECGRCGEDHECNHFAHQITSLHSRSGACRASAALRKRSRASGSSPRRRARSPCAVQAAAV